MALNLVHNTWSTWIIKNFDGELAVILIIVFQLIFAISLTLSEELIFVLNSLSRYDQRGWLGEVTPKRGRWRTTSFETSLCNATIFGKFLGKFVNEKALKVNFFGMFVRASERRRSENSKKGSKLLLGQKLRELEHLEFSKFVKIWYETPKQTLWCWSPELIQHTFNPIWLTSLSSSQRSIKWLHLSIHSVYCQPTCCSDQ